ncbi:unnamed protein product [Mycena citricolor]|uniref:Uncharacterized protein n=1 Tax=Mycena citricolor TaxID=2018698 RepID=A0AAD2HA17_9AGAR|nr:unnamed protein product [Mycena citricolor]
MADQMMRDIVIETAKLELGYIPKDRMSEHFRTHRKPDTSGYPARGHQHRKNP